MLRKNLFELKSKFQCPPLHDPWFRNVTAQDIWLSVQWFQRFLCLVGFLDVATVLTQKSWDVKQVKRYQVWSFRQVVTTTPKKTVLHFEFEKSVVCLHSRDKLKATSTIYTLVKLRSVEPSPSFQDMAVISWTPSSWSLCFTKTGKTKFICQTSEKR